MASFFALVLTQSIQKNAENMKRTNAQNARFHQLLTERKFDKQDKQALVLTYTGGRSDSSADMTKQEMAEAIKHLEGFEVASIRKMRAKIINIAKDIFEVADMHQTDWDNLNAFLVKKFKGKLNELPYPTLIKAVTAMERWKQSHDKKRTVPPPITPNPYRPVAAKPAMPPGIEPRWLVMDDDQTLDDFNELHERFVIQADGLQIKIATAKMVDVNDIYELRDAQAVLVHLRNYYAIQHFNREN